MIPILKYPRTPHIAGSRIPPGDEDLKVIAREVLEGRSIVIEEKLDGSNNRAEPLARWCGPLRMIAFPLPCPAPPVWGVDWPALTEEFEWIRAMYDCPQDPVFHAEGTVWTHVRMVCEALAGLEEFR